MLLEFVLYLQLSTSLINCSVYAKNNAMNAYDRQKITLRVVFTCSITATSTKCLFNKILGVITHAAPVIPTVMLTVSNHSKIILSIISSGLPSMLYQQWEHVLKHNCMLTYLGTEYFRNSLEVISENLPIHQSAAIEQAMPSTRNRIHKGGHDNLGNLIQERISVLIKKVHHSIHCCISLDHIHGHTVNKH